MMFDLYKKDKLIAHFQFWDDAEDFIEELKRLNSNEIDRREFKVMINNAIPAINQIILFSYSYS